MSFTWAKDYPDLQLKCRLFGMYELDDPLRYKYTNLEGFIQDGPQCGLVALAICTGNANKDFVNAIFEYAKGERLTNNGEIFSVDYMFKLCKRFLPNNEVQIHSGTLNDEKVINFLLTGGLLLVPYDCDWNHQPCLRNGHKAHWAIIIGVIETTEETFVIAKHGKSLNLAIWSLSNLAISNQQLVEFSPDRKQSNLVYVLPEGGLAGKEGLCNRAVFVYPNN